MLVPRVLTTPPFCATTKSAPTWYPGTCFGGQVRSSKKAMSGSRLDGKTRPMSAPPGGFQGRSSHNSNHRTPAMMLVPSLEGIPTSSISLAELDACATLTRNFEEGGSPLGVSNKHRTVFLRQSSSSAGIIPDRDRRRRRRRPISSSMSPDNHDDDNKLAHTRDHISTVATVGPTTNQAKKSKIPPQLDLLFDRLQRLGPGATCGRLEPHGASLGTASSTALMMTSAGTDSHVLTRHRPASAGGGRPRARDLDGCRVALAEHLAARKRENELGRSDVSVRCDMQQYRYAYDKWCVSCLLMVFQRQYLMFHSRMYLPCMYSFSIYNPACVLRKNIKWNRVRARSAIQRSVI